MILVVEDDDDVRNLAANLLTDEGFRVLTARDGKEGLAMIQTEPSIRVLFTDIMMPGMDGWELAHQAKTLRPELRVIYTTGEMKNIPFGKSGVGYGPLLPKPYRREQLRDHINRVTR